MKKNVEIKECPYCGGTEFREGQQIAQGNLLPTGGMLKGKLSKGTPMYHTVCMSCGSIVHSYVDKVDIFK